MVVDLIAKANYFSSIARTEEWITYILEFTMESRDIDAKDLAITI
jgi:hypothetical protein